MRSAVASKIPIEYGFESVYKMLGGIDAWVEPCTLSLVMCWSKLTGVSFGFMNCQ